MSSDSSTVVLVHGAWADGSSWSKVVLGLARKGVRTVAAPLPLTAYADDVAALDHVLDRVDGAIVLVGHAYAGAVIGGVQNANVCSLVYVAGLAPDEGETVADVFYRLAAHPLASALGPDAHGLIWLPDDAFASAFAQNATAEEQTVLRAVQRPISPACITVPVGRPRWKELPSWFLAAQDDRMIVPETQVFMARRMGAVTRTLPVDHTPSVTAPEAVIDLIEEALRGA